MGEKAGAENLERFFDAVAQTLAHTTALLDALLV